MSDWKEISQQQNLELSKELLERQGIINELKAEVAKLNAELAQSMLATGNALHAVAKVERLTAERVQLEQLCRDNAWLNRDQVLEVLNGEGQAEVTSEPCGSCEGSRWVDDENWQPEDWEWVRGRIPSSGRIPCGICNEGGWSIPDIKPGVEATAAAAETATFISRPACGCSVDVASGHSTYCGEHSDSRFPWQCTCTRCVNTEPVGLRGGDDDA